MNETGGVSGRIRTTMGDFTPAERRVARSLLARGATFGLESSSSLAKRIGVSGPTVSRFASKLGFANYGDFQRALREELEARITSPLTLYPSDTGPDGSTDSLLHRSSEALCAAVKETLHNVPPNELEGAVTLLSDERRQVLVFGGRFSNILARHLVDQFQELRVGVRFIAATPHERLAALSEVNRHYVAVVFDFRRYESETIALARRMDVEGARIILFTDRWLSPLAEVADVVFSASLGQPSPFDSLISGMALIEVLMTSVVQAIGPKGRAHFERYNRLVEEFVPNWGEEAASKNGKRTIPFNTRD